MSCACFNDIDFCLFRSILNKVYNILTASTDVSNTGEGCRGISLSDFMKLMQCYKPMRGIQILNFSDYVKLSDRPLMSTVHNHIHGHDIITSAESEVLCMFKVLIGSNNQDQVQMHNKTISRERFLTLYEMRDLRWRQARSIEQVLDNFLPMSWDHTYTCR